MDVVDGVMRPQVARVGNDRWKQSVQMRCAIRRRERCEDGAFDGWLNRRPGAVLVEPVVESRHGHLFVPSHSSADYRLRRSVTASRVFDLLSFT